MHGKTSPEAFQRPDAPGDVEARRPLLSRLRKHWNRHRYFALLVLLPTLAAAIYFGAIASDQYESEARFVVRVAGVQSGAASGLGSLLGIKTDLTGSQTESQGLGDYLTSHDAVRVLNRDKRLQAAFERPDIDVFSRLEPAASPETLLEYYRKQIDVRYSSETGITTLKVRAFSPADAHAIAAKLLAIGELRANMLNQRAYGDALRVSQRQLADAETELAAVQARLTGFRQQKQDINPQLSSNAQIQLVSDMEASLSAARAQLAGMGRAISTSSPQYEAMRQRVDAMAGQLAGQRGRLTGGNTAIAPDLGGYEELQLRQQFAAKRYEAAAAGFESAREQAVRQQLFVIRLVEPNRPVKALYPKRWKIVGSTFLGLLLAYGIGWLIAAGVREHSA